VNAKARGFFFLLLFVFELAPALSFHLIGSARIPFGRRSVRRPKRCSPPPCVATGSARPLSPVFGKRPHDRKCKVREAHEYPALDETPTTAIGTARALRSRSMGGGGCDSRGDKLRYPSNVDINKMLNDLRMEREQLSEAILVL